MGYSRLSVAVQQTAVASIGLTGTGVYPAFSTLKAGLMQVLCVSARVATSTTALVATAVVSVGVLGVSPTPTPHQLAAHLTSATQTAAGTALHDGLEATGPTIASLLATSPTLLSTTSVHQLAALATTPASTRSLITSGTVLGGTSGATTGGAGQVPVANALAGLPTLNPADADAVIAAAQALIGQFVQSFLTTPEAIRVALERVAQGDVNGAFASLENLVIQPIVKYASSPYPDQAARAIGRYLYSQLAAAVTAAPGIFRSQETRIFDLVTSTRRSVVDAVQGVIASLGTLNPVAVAGAVASGLGNVVDTAVANTFGANGGFAIARDVVNALIQAAFPDPPAVTNTAVTLTTRASSATTPTQSTAGTTQSSPSTLGTSIHATSTRSETSSVPTTSVSTFSTAEAHTPATPKIAVQDATAATDGSALAHPSAGTVKPDVAQAPTKTVDVTSGNKVQPETTTDQSATSHSASGKGSSTATDASSATDSPTTAKTDAGTDKTTSKPGAGS